MYHHKLRNAPRPQREHEREMRQVAVVGYKAGEIGGSTDANADYVSGLVCRVCSRLSLGDRCCVFVRMPMPLSVAWLLRRF